MIAPPALPPLSGRISARSATVSSSAIRDLLAVVARPDVISLAGGLPDAIAMPADRVRECLDWALSQPGALQYSATEGDPGLREIIAAREGASCGFPVGAGQVLITSGAQQGLDLIGKALLDPGDVVVVENPAYVGAIQAFQLAGARLVAVGQDGDGLDTAELAELLSRGLRPRLLYTTATFHNPAGTTLSAPRRAELAGLAERYGFWIAEDDAYRELYFTAPPPPPIAAADGHLRRVIRLGTFSKIVSPGLRIGWLAADPELVTVFAKLKQATDLHTSTLAQLSLRRVAADAGWLDGHIAAIRARYRDRARHLITGLGAAFGPAITFSEPGGGMFCWVRFRDGTSASALLPRAMAAGVAFVPGGAFSASGGNDDAMRLCFATVPEPALTEALGRLTSAWRQDAV